MVGRSVELSAIQGLLESPQGKVLLVSGEAGIGKSRLVAESRARAEALGFRVLQGNCFEPDKTLPYAPFLDMLGPVLFPQNLDQSLRNSLQAGGEYLVPLFPELKSLFPGFQPSMTSDPAEYKHHLIQAFINLFLALAQHQPLLVVLEDLHWSDDNSLELLLHLAYRLPGHPILMMLTYRSDEVHPNLAHLLARLDQRRLAVELGLSRLDTDGVEAMIRAIFSLDRPVHSEFLKAINELTDGNPFFIEEVLKSLIAAAGTFNGEQVWEQKLVEGLRIPRSVQDAVQHRLEQLSPMARQLLSLAAVVGRRFQFSLLQQLTGLDEDSLVAVLKELVSAQLVVEESEDRFAFRHALTQQAIYAPLLARERKRLHKDVAEALEQVYRDSKEEHLSDLARHFFEAGVWEKALDYSQWAGQRVLVLYSPQVAVQHFSHAMEAAHHLGLTPSMGLYRSRGAAYDMLGNFPKALADYEQALNVARSSLDRQGEWQALLDLGLLWASRDYSRTIDYYQQALRLARAMGDQKVLAHTLNRVGNWYVNRDQPREGKSYHQEALTIFQALKDNHGLAQTLDMLALATPVTGTCSRAWPVTVKRWTCTNKPRTNRVW